MQTHKKYLIFMYILEIRGSNRVEPKYPNQNREPNRKQNMLFGSVLSS